MLVHAPLEVPDLLAELKRCSRSRDLAGGKELHSRVIQCPGLFSNRYVASALLNMYAKCGRMADARDVFDSIVERNVVSWNALLQGYVENGDYELAVELFDFMGLESEDGCAPNARSFVSALSACAAAAGKNGRNPSRKNGEIIKWLERGKAIHSQAALNLCCEDGFVRTLLVKMYAKCGSMANARSVFNQMVDRDIICWTVMLQGYVENGESKMALDLFEAMQEEGECIPDAVTYLAAITACTTLASENGIGKMLEKGKELHSRAVMNKCYDIYVENALVDMYAKAKRMAHAQAVFDSMDEAHSVGWNSLIQGYVDNAEPELALELFGAIDEGAGSCPDSRSFVHALSACASLSQEGRLKLEEAKALHSRAVMSGCCCGDIYVETTLVDTYSKSGSMRHARSVFNSMKSRNVVSWNAVLKGYVDNGEPEVALDLFHKMEEEEKEECRPDRRSFIVALAACAACAIKSANERGKLCRLLQTGKSLHSRAALSCFCADITFGSSLVNMYAKCGNMRHAQGVFDTMTEEHFDDVDVVAWNGLIQGYVDNGENQAALELVARMDLSGAGQSAGTFVAALMACGNLMDLKTGEAYHAEILSCGLDKDPAVTIFLVEFYGRCSSMKDAERVFDEIPAKNVWAWNSLLCGYSQQGDTRQIFQAFEEMKRKQVLPNEVTFTHILNACSHAGETDKARGYFDRMKSEYGIAPNLIHYTCMIDLLSRANLLDEALQMLKSMPFEAGTVTWTALLAGCRKWKNVQVGKIAYESLLTLNQQQQLQHAVSTQAYVLMANIYAASDGEGLLLKPGFAASPSPQGTTWWSDGRGSGRVLRFAAGTEKLYDPVVHSKITDILNHLKEQGYILN